MKEEILNNLENPRQLEQLYRNDKSAFKKAFNDLYTSIQDNPAAQIWHERLNFESEGISWGTNYELAFVIVASFIAGLVAKFPEFSGVNEEYFYSRNLSFIVFPFLAAYFLWRQKVAMNKVIIVAVAVLAAVLYINLLPDNPKSDTLILACIHLPLFLWAVLGYSFLGGKLKDYSRRLAFLRYNGDLVVMTTLILISGGILTGITLGLFSLIEVNIEGIYFKYIVIFGLAAAPMVGTYLVQTNPHLVNKVSPVIAQVFTPLVLVTLVVYLIAVITTGKDPYNDRDFLMVFNVLLIGVMAIILFSIAETTRNSNNQISTVMLLLLSITTIIVNGIALSAIVFRISEWGITPNRIAVLGSNLLILSNLLMVTYQLFKAVKDQNQIDKVENSIAWFLPVYSAWTVVVTFLFPLLFGFK
jgi:hypothetical protein